MAASATVNTVDRIELGLPGLQILRANLTLSSARAAALTDVVDLSAYTPEIFGVSLEIDNAKPIWLGILDTNFSSGKFDVKGFSAAAAVGSATDLASVTCNAVVFCRNQGVGAGMTRL